jgi:hypothetical protein
MASEDLARENEHLRAELAAVRQSSAGGVNPVVAQHEAAAAGAYQQAEAGLKALEQKHAALQAEGEFEKAAELQRQIAALVAQQEQARQHWQGWNSMRSAHPVEQFIAANQNLFTADEQNWIRQHPEYATDSNFRQRIIDAHQQALSDGYRRGSAAYLARLDLEAARLGGSVGGPAPQLTGDQLDVARSCYLAQNPEQAGNSRDDRTISDWWHRQRHSQSAYRMRENWLNTLER